jgi:hypothetical protein
MNYKSPSTPKKNKNNQTTYSDLNNLPSNSHVNHIQSVSNDVFNSSEEINEDGFVTPKSKNTSKRNYSSSDSPDTKKMFITVNRFAPLTTRNSQNEYNFTENENDAHINDINIEASDETKISNKNFPLQLLSKVY